MYVMLDVMLLYHVMFGMWCAVMMTVLCGDVMWWRGVMWRYVMIGCYVVLCFEFFFDVMLRYVYVMLHVNVREKLCYVLLCFVMLRMLCWIFWSESRHKAIWNQNVTFWTGKSQFFWSSTLISRAFEWCQNDWKILPEEKVRRNYLLRRFRWPTCTMYECMRVLYVCKCVCMCGCVVCV